MGSMTLWDNPETMAGFIRWAGWISAILAVFVAIVVCVALAARWRVGWTVAIPAVFAAVAALVVLAAHEQAAKIEETLKKETPNLDASLIQEASGKLGVIIFAKSLVPVEAHWQISFETVEPGGRSSGMASYSRTLHPRKRKNRLFFFEAVNPILPSGKQVELRLGFQFESLYAEELGLAELRGEQSKSYRLTPDGRLQEVSE